VDIAAYGWEHPEWDGVFYPEDMPGEWRLDFYCNEFRAIVIPAEKWAGSDCDPLDEWVGALGDDTRVYLELPPEPPASRVREAVAAMTGRVAGFVGRAPSRVSPEQLGAPVGIWSRQPVDTAAGIGWCRPEQGGIPRCTGGGLASAWVGSEPIEPMHLRRVMEGLAAGGRADNAVLVFEGRPPSLKLMRDARTLAELMGL